MMSRKWRIILLLAGLALIGLSQGCGAAEEPLPSEANTQAPVPVFAPTQAMATPTAQSLNTPVSPALPAIPERRRVTLEFPPRIRLGDSDIIRLALEMDDEGGITSTAQ